MVASIDQENINMQFTFFFFFQSFESEIFCVYILLRERAWKSIIKWLIEKTCSLESFF